MCSLPCFFKIPDHAGISVKVRGRWPTRSRTPCSSRQGSLGGWRVLWTQTNVEQHSPKTLCALPLTLCACVLSDVSVHFWCPVFNSLALLFPQLLVCFQVRLKSQLLLRLCLTPPASIFLALTVCHYYGTHQSLLNCTYLLLFFPTRLLWGQG